MYVCCGVISLIILLALLGSMVQPIVAKIGRIAWARTLVGLPMGKLKSELTALKQKKGGLTSGYLGMSSGQQHHVVSKLNDVEARIRVLERLISKRQRLESGKSD
jgi:hypothetical protein